MLIDQKSNLARLMATENLTIEEKNVNTAYFDLKNRILTVPILNGNLSSYVYDLFMGHEVGHALETPIEGYHDSVYDHGVNHTILNVCEDARIEKKIKRKFPGLRISFLKAYQELVIMDFFSIKGENVNKYNLIDRINLHTKVGSSLNIQFSEEESLLLEEVENTETFEEVVIVAKKIQKYMNNNNKKKKTKDVDMSDGDDIEEIDSNEFEDFEEIGSNDFEEHESIKSDIKKSVENNGSSGNSETSVSKSEEEDSDEETSGTEDSSKIESKTHNAFRSNEGKLFNRTTSAVRYCNIPKLEISEFVVSPEKILSMLNKPNLANSGDDIAVILKSLFEKEKVEFQKFKSSNDRIVSYLVKEFELRKNADQQSRAKISKSGDINMNKIYDYKFTDDIFKKMMTVPNGKSHGLVMYIDWSGSMATHIHSTIKQMLTLVYFCKKVNIPFEVYAFTTNFDRTKIGCKKRTNYETNDLFISNSTFTLLNFFHNKMRNSEINEMATYLYSFYRDYRRNIFFNDDLCLGGTPLNEAVVSAFEIVPQFKKNNNLQIVNTIFLTDGDGHKITDNLFNNKINSLISHPSKTIIRDKKNKCQVDVLKYSNLSRNYETIGLIQLLKQRAGGNVISFYISSAREVRSKIMETLRINGHKYSISQNDAFVDKYFNDFRKEGSIVFKSNYYDELYMIKSDSLDFDDSSFMSKENQNVEDMNAKKLASAFTKYNEGKFQSRTFLNRFVQIIS